MEAITFRRALYAAPFELRPSCTSFRFPCQHRLRASATARPYASESSLPRVIQPSIWQALIPKPFRRDADGRRPAAALYNTSEWNPATIYIVLGLLVGSQAINLMMLRKEYATFTRQAEAKIALLREVIERVQKGEEVDVRGLLGTGKQKEETEWKRVLKEVENEDLMRGSQSAKDTAAPSAKREQKKSATEQVAHDSTGAREKQDVSGKNSGARFL